MLKPGNLTQESENYGTKLGKFELFWNQMMDLQIRTGSSAPDTIVINGRCYS